MKTVDLHTHTFFSDGTYSPEELVQKARAAGLAALGVTDHDTVEGIPRALAAGLEAGVVIIPGIELSAELEGTEIHILGYCVDHTNQPLRQQLAVLKENRIERVYRMVDKLNELGVALRPESVFALAREGTVGRLHVARALAQEKLIGSIQEAFTRYIGDRGPAYALGFRFAPSDAIALIRQAGAVPVLAHPYTLRNDDLIPQLVGLGLMGLEVFYPEHAQSTVNFYRAFAKKHSLLMTGGSDYHGTAKSGIQLNCMNVPYEIVDQLRQAAESVR